MGSVSNQEFPGWVTRCAELCDLMKLFSLTLSVRLRWNIFWGLCSNTWCVELLKFWRAEIVYLSPARLHVQRDSFMLLRVFFSQVIRSLNLSDRFVPSYPNVSFGSIRASFTHGAGSVPHALFIRRSVQDRRGRRTEHRGGFAVLPWSRRV